MRSDVFDVIETIEHAVLAKLVVFKLVCRAVGQGNSLGFEIDCHFVVGASCRLKNLIDDFCRKHYEQERILSAVVIEDVGERLGDDDLEACTGQCPDGVFARRTTTEIAVGDKYCRSVKFFAIHREIGIIVAHTAE